MHTFRRASTEPESITARARDVKVQLTRKFAQMLNGVDLSHWLVGEVVDVPEREAQMLIAEAWASPLSSSRERATANDTPSKTP